MAITDIVIIVIVALFALIGLWKGFFKTLISFFGWFIAMLIAVLTARVVAEALLDIPAVGKFVVGSDGFSLFGALKNMLPEGLMALPAGATEAEIAGALGDGVVASLLKPFTKLLTEMGTTASAATVGDGIGIALSGGLFEVMVGIGMFIVCRIVMTLFTLFFKSLIDKDKKMGVLTRLGGFLFGAVRGTLYCAILLVAVGFLTPFQFMQPVTADIDKGVLAKPIAQSVYTLSGKITSHENYFNKLLELAGLKDSAPVEEDEDATKVKDFLTNAAVDNGGLFGKQLIGGEGRDRYNAWTQGLISHMQTAAAKIANGDYDSQQESMAALAEAVKAGGEAEQAGLIYSTFEALADVLDRYNKCDDTEMDALETEVEVSFANIKYALDNTPYSNMFGEVQFGGLEAEPTIGAEVTPPQEEGGEESIRSARMRTAYTVEWAGA